MKFKLSLLATACLLSTGVIAKSNDLDYSAFSWRELGPAMTSGRIADLAVNPNNASEYYVAVASGGVWKTTDAGTTFQPIFDGESSYSIGDVTLDPNNPNVVWVGTGENNSQRSVSFGDGVYKSVDGGKSWKNMGLETSEHIGKIIIDPRHSNTVFVAAQGPLWNKGGDRGLYKTTDGGKSWKNVLKISEHTGVNEVVFNPENPDIMYASSYQRRRHVWTLINGGPESTIYKSTDGGENWRKVNSGLPGGDLGRIGLAIAPSNPNVVYAIVEATKGKSGFYRSTDGGESWNKQSSYVSGSPQYYQEIVVDPTNENRVYSLDTYMMVSEDGGKNFKRLGEKNKHVDNHALWIDPNNTDHLIVGCDGGLYESWTRGKNWDFKPNLPVTQFYRVAVDYDTPFYSVYGGTQDNFSLGAPTRTIFSHGIDNSDWIITQTGDGFKTVIDPTDPNTIYSQAQYGYLSRIDKQSRENMPITPVHPDPKQVMRWNWNSPILISPHNHKRIYYASQVLFKSDDRGNSWTPISGDLSKNIDRNKLKVMDTVWSIDSVAKNKSTSIYGSIVSLSESSLAEGLLYTGSDDGVMYRTTSGGDKWQQMDWPGKVPEMTYVSDLEASLHDKNVVFASFDNHKRGDYKPYVYISDDQGKSWDNIAGDLPDKGTVYTIAQDHVNPELLFVGTEYGVYFTQNKGKNWHQLKSGLPTIAVRDIDIQRRENDLAIATFGRGIYIMDNYAPLRAAAKDVANQEATLFTVKDTWQYVENSRFGYSDLGFQGASFYAAKNPEYGAEFVYHLKDGYKTDKSKRKAQESNLRKDDKPVYYPSWQSLEDEQRQVAPEIILTIKDANGDVVRKLSGATSKGFHKVYWDLRYPGYGKANKDASGPMVMPGEYSVSISKVIDGKEEPFSQSQTFTVKKLENQTLPTANRAADLAFEHKAGKLLNLVTAANEKMESLEEQMDKLVDAVRQSPSLDNALEQRIYNLQNQYKDIEKLLNGDSLKASYNEAAVAGINSWMGDLAWGRSESTAEVTATHKRLYEFTKSALTELYPQMKSLQQEIISIQQTLNDANAPWTPGRLPELKFD